MEYCVIKHLILLKIQNMMDIKGILPQWFIKFLIKRLWGGAVKNEIVENKELAEELHKPFIRKFKKRKVQSSIINNIWRADLADMKFDFCCVLLIFIVNIFGLFLRKIRRYYNY